jgi:hypothetical protein
MSKKIKEIENTGVYNTTLDLTQFTGGARKGIMLQLTQGFGGCHSVAPINDNDEPGFIQLTQRDAYLVAIELVKWLQGNAKDKAEYLREQIEKDKELERTIFKDAVKCEKFIRDLQMLDTPLGLLGVETE